MTSKLNIGLIGLGRLGRSYATYLASRVPGARLHSAADVQPDAVQAVATDTGAKGSTDYRTLLADPEVDAVVVATPTKLHCEVVLAAARAGKAVFCEKPLSLSLVEAQAMKAAVADSGIFFQLGFMRRFDPAYAAAWAKIREGAIGRPCVFKSSSRDRERPSLEYLQFETSGGLFLDMGIHDFDLARWFMGEVTSVFGSAGVLAYPEMASTGDWDNAFASLTFANGCIGMVSLSRNGIYGYSIQTEIVGTEGTIQIGSDRHTPLLLMKPNAVTHDTMPGFYERFADAYVNQLCDFVGSLSQGKQPSVGCDDGVAAQRIAVAATESAREGRLIAL